ncbi:MAG: hypothetical protein KF857_01490 [Fimbriimonadaceae bacterium]|nr:hypothetical protein [Fimbriimonadaceae bacterium]
MTVAALAALANAPSTPRAVVVAWDGARSAPILTRIDSRFDTDTLRKVAGETGFRLEFMGGDAYCFQVGMMGESNLLAQRALYGEVARSAKSQRGLLDRRGLSPSNWTALRLQIASELASEGVTEADLESSRIVVLPDYRVTMRAGENTRDFFPATASQPNASDVVDAPAGPRQLVNTSVVKTGRLQTAMTIFSSDLGAREQAVLMRQASEMMEHYIDRLTGDVATSARAAFLALSEGAGDDQRIDTQAANLGAMSVESQLYLAGAFANSYRSAGFDAPAQARAFLSAATFDRIEPVLVLMVTLTTRQGGIKTFSLVMPRFVN